MSHLTPFHHPFIALLPYTMKREKNLKQGLEEIITDIYPKHFNGFTLKIQQHPIGHQYLFLRRVSKEIRIVYICITIKIKAKKEDMAQTPSIPKGTRDYSPEVMVKRNYIFDTIKSVFKLYGYLPLETPAMENLSTLMGKYGEEGDKLLFKILNSGDFLAPVTNSEVEERNIPRLTNKICEKGLRYDLTVPFARFVVQHQNEISFPFKRYQIQPVWRADRPQKGRYREFYQCDVDVVGSDSLLNEVELVQIVDEVYKRLKINGPVVDQQPESAGGIAETIGHPDKLVDITVAIDKMDKIGAENVNAELREKGVSEEAIEKLQPILRWKVPTRRN